ALKPLGYYLSSLWDLKTYSALYAASNLRQRSWREMWSLRETWWGRTKIGKGRRGNNCKALKKDEPTRSAECGTPINREQVRRRSRARGAFFFLPLALDARTRGIHSRRALHSFCST